jgi:sulfur-oxidizing protein SoxZ
MGNMKIKAKLKGDVVDVKVMAKHDMLTYDQAKKKGVDANFITHITATANGKVVYDVSTSQFWSKNPQFKFSFKGAAKGDEVSINTFFLCLIICKHVMFCHYFYVYNIAFKLCFNFHITHNIPFLSISVYIY